MDFFLVKVDASLSLAWFQRRNCSGKMPKFRAIDFMDSPAARLVSISSKNLSFWPLDSRFLPILEFQRQQKKTKNEALAEEEEIEKEESAAFTHEKDLEKGNLKIKNFSFLAKIKHNVRKKSCVV